MPPAPGGAPGGRATGVVSLPTVPPRCALKALNLVLSRVQSVLNSTAVDLSVLCTLIAVKYAYCKL